MTETVRAAGFLVFRTAPNGFQYLMLKASYGSLHWTPPKGHVDPGENDLDTAYRETNEEAGLWKEHLKLFPDFKAELMYKAHGKPKTTIYWLAQLIGKSEICLSKEHTEYRWATLEEACALTPYEDLKNAIHDAEAFLSGKNLT